MPPSRPGLGWRVQSRTSSRRKATGPPLRREFLDHGDHLPALPSREFALENGERSAIRRDSPIDLFGPGRFPCTFPVEQGIRGRDGFAPDRPHRHRVSSSRDFPRSHQSVAGRTRVIAGFCVSRVRQSEPETAGFLRLGPRRPHFSLLLGLRAVRFRDRFAASRAASGRPSGSGRTLSFGPRTRAAALAPPSEAADQSAR